MSTEAVIIELALFALGAWAIHFMLVDVPGCGCNSNQGRRACRCDHAA